MTTHTNGIVLRYFKYGEKSLIAHIYTEKYGRQSFIFKGAKSKKSKQKLNFLQPLFLLEIPIHYKENKELYTGNGTCLEYSFQSIPFHHIKNAIAFFIAEFLSKTLHTQEADTQLFHFLKTSILQFDKDTSGYSNFHLHFLIKFMNYIGIQPQANYSLTSPYLCISQGEFLHQELPDSFTKEESFTFHQLKENSWEENRQLPLSRQKRNALLDKLLNYYTYHISEVKQMKSLPVLKELFT